MNDALLLAGLLGLFIIGGAGVMVLIAKSAQTLKDRRQLAKMRRLEEERWRRNQ